MCVPRLLGRVDRSRSEPWQLAFLSQLSVRLEDFDHRPTGLRHRNPRAHPYPRAEWSASSQPLVKGIANHRPEAIHIATPRAGSNGVLARPMPIQLLGCLCPFADRCLIGYASRAWSR